MSKQENRGRKSKLCPVCGEPYTVENNSNRQNIIFGSRNSINGQPTDDAISILSNKEDICVSFEESSGLSIFHH